MSSWPAWLHTQGYPIFCCHYISVEMHCILCQPSCILHFFQTCERLDCHELYGVAKDWPIDHCTRPNTHMHNYVATTGHIVHCNATWIFGTFGPESSRKYVLVFSDHFWGVTTRVPFWRVASHGRDRIDALSCAEVAMQVVVPYGTPWENKNIYYARC